MADELGIETVEPLVEGMSWGTGAPWKWSSARLVRSREEVGDRPARSGWFRDGCDGSARLMCGEIGFLAVIGFLSGMPRGKTPGRVFLRFRNGERNRAQTAKSSISPHVDPPARRPGSRSRRLRAAFGREAAGCGRPFCVACRFRALGGSVAFVDVVGVVYPFPNMLRFL